MNSSLYIEHQTGRGKIIKAWTQGVTFEETARQQLEHVADLPFVGPWVAVMPDVHMGKGASIGSIIPSKKAIIPAAVGVDIGCGMVAQRLSLKAKDLPDQLYGVRESLEKNVPHGSSRGKKDKGAWDLLPKTVRTAWHPLAQGYERIVRKHQVLAKANHVNHLGTLGGGNHFVELCLDEEGSVWIMLHSGSRGIGNAIGSYFIELAKQDMRVHQINLPDQNLAYLREGTNYFDDYWDAVTWAQNFAAVNRQVMLTHILEGLRQLKGFPPFHCEEQAVNCHHNYVALENHFGQQYYITRKGAVRAGAGDLGIIPGSMGAQSFIVRGKGSPESFMSCSHGAGRLMSRSEAKKRFTLADHIKATAGVECRKDLSVIDETPAAYKPVKAVINAQKDLVEVVHTLKQIVCVKG